MTLPLQAVLPRKVGVGVSWAVLACFAQAGKPVLPATEPTMRIAAAANLATVLPSLISAFNQTNLPPNDHMSSRVQGLPNYFKGRIEVTYGSSGNLYAQINQHAPYDMFLSANQALPNQLFKDNSSTYSAPFTYTRGQLALYSTHKQVMLTDAQATFKTLIKQNIPYKVALAKPNLAPYGLAAQVWLMQNHLYDLIKPHMAMGNNIEQTFQFVDTGNADLGFVAWSQVLAKLNQSRGGVTKHMPLMQYNVLPANSYPPILQDGIMLTKTPLGQAFYHFLCSKQGQAILAHAGYLPVY